MHTYVMSQQPDPFARWVSHALVGAAAAGLVGLFVAKRSAPSAQLVSALVAVMLHERFDAPVASIVGQYI